MNIEDCDILEDLTLSMEDYDRFEKEIDLAIREGRVRQYFCLKKLKELNNGL